jgi:hypothetical protein
LKIFLALDSAVFFKDDPTVKPAVFFSDVCDFDNPVLAEFSNFVADFFARLFAGFFIL